MGNRNGGYYGGSTLLHFWPPTRRKKRKSINLKVDFDALESLRIQEAVITGKIQETVYKETRFCGFKVLLFNVGVEVSGSALAFCPASLFYNANTPNQYVGQNAPFQVVKVEYKCNRVGCVVAGVGCTSS